MNSKILKIDSPQRNLQRFELAEYTDQSEKSSAWTANLAALRKLGLIEYENARGEKFIRLTDLLFPE